MTREEAKEMLPIIQAFAEGKKIQLFTNGIWETAKNPTFESGAMYRIEPEPKYRPFKTKEECWQEMHKHPDFGWVINEGVYMIVQSIYNDEIYTAELLDNIDYKYAVENLIFTDGTPFGIKEE